MGLLSYCCFLFISHCFFFVLFFKSWEFTYKLGPNMFVSNLSEWMHTICMSGGSKSTRQFSFAFSQSIRCDLGSQESVIDTPSNQEVTLWTDRVGKGWMGRVRVQLNIITPPILVIFTTVHPHLQCLHTRK